MWQWWRGRRKDPVQRISDIPSNCFRYRIEGLKKGTLYSVSVAAHTDTDQGPESLPILIRTEEDGMSIWRCLNLTHDLKLSLPFLHLPKAHLSSQHLPYPETSAALFLTSPKLLFLEGFFPSVSTIAILSPWWKHGQILSKAIVNECYTSFPHLFRPPPVSRKECWAVITCPLLKCPFSAQRTATGCGCGGLKRHLCQSVMETSSCWATAWKDSWLPGDIRQTNSRGENSLSQN